jgi:hypothetical protein
MTRSGSGSPDGQKTHGDDDAAGDAVDDDDDDDDDGCADGAYDVVGR